MTLGDVGQERPDPIVLENVSPVHLLTAGYGPVAQFQDFVLDSEATVWVLEHCPAPAGEGPLNLARLKTKQHLLIFPRQIVEADLARLRILV